MSVHEKGMDSYSNDIIIHWNTFMELFYVLRVAAGLVPFIMAITDWTRDKIIN